MHAMSNILIRHTLLSLLLRTLAAPKRTFWRFALHFKPKTYVSQNSVSKRALGKYVLTLRFEPEIQRRCHHGGIGRPLKSPLVWLWDLLLVPLFRWGEARKVRLGHLVTCIVCICISVLVLNIRFGSRFGSLPGVAFWAHLARLSWWGCYSVGFATVCVLATFWARSERQLSN